MAKPAMTTNGSAVITLGSHRPRTAGTPRCHRHAIASSVATIRRAASSASGSSDDLMLVRYGLDSSSPSASP